MSNVFLYFLLMFIFGFLGMFAIFSPLANKYSHTLKFENKMAPIQYIFLFYVLGSLSSYFLVDINDFIEPITLKRIIIPILLSIVIYLSAQILSFKSLSIVVLGCLAITVYLQPVSIGSPFPNIPEWLLKLIVILFFSIFCLFYRILNCIPQSIIIPSVITILGVCVLSLIGAAPIYSALSIIMFVGALLAYLGVNFYETKIGFDDADCTVIGYIIANLLLQNLGEYNFTSCIIFTSVFWAELVVAIWNKVMVFKSGSLMENTNYFIAANKYNSKIMGMNIAKVAVISAFIGWFQLFSINQYSLIIISLFIILWLNNSIGTAFEKKKSLKEINKDFVEDIKRNIDDAKKLLSEESFNTKNKKINNEKKKVRSEKVTTKKKTSKENKTKSTKKNNVQTKKGTK